MTNVIRTVGAGIVLIVVLFAGSLRECSASTEERAADGGAVSIVFRLRSPSPARMDAFAAGMAKRTAGMRVEPVVGDVYLAKVRLDEALNNEKAVLNEFMASGLVEFARPDGILYPPPDIAALRAEPAEQEKTWFLTKIQAPVFWEKSKGSKAIKVLVCDTGVESGHPDLRGNIGPGINLVDGSANTEPTGNGHGTRIAGLIGARGGHTGTGASGVNWDVTIIPGKISNQANGGAVHTDTAKCIKWGADQGIRIVNLSFSGAVDEPVIQEAAKYLRSHNGVLIMSAGNNGVRNDFPDNPDMIVVGGTNDIDWKPPYSNTGPYVDLTAPGSALYSTDAGGKYSKTSGTSLATAVVSGSAALMLSVKPNMTADQLADLVLKSTMDLGTPGRDEAFGAGRLDLKKALEFLTPWR